MHARSRLCEKRKRVRAAITPSAAPAPGGAGPQAAALQEVQADGDVGVRRRGDVVGGCGQEGVGEGPGGARAHPGRGLAW